MSKFPDDLILNPDWLSSDPRLDSEMRISAAMMHYPIIISSDGLVIDGRHRIVKARRHMLTHIRAVTATDEDLLACVY